MADEAKKSLISKIAEACDAVGGIAKQGRNKEQGYTYMRAADIAKAFRHELFSRGVVVLQSEDAPEYIEVGKTSKGNPVFECRLKITFTLTDGTEDRALVAFGVARDSADKALWKSKTGAMKYFLRGLGIVPDEKDDPEYSGKTSSADEGEMHEEEPETTLTLAGLILEEKATKDYIWYKIETLVGDGQAATVFVKSPAETDSGRLADRVGYLVSLKVKPSLGSKGSIFVLLDVLQVRKPAESSSTGVGGQTTQEPPKATHPATPPPKKQTAPKLPPEAKEGHSTDPSSALPVATKGQQPKAATSAGQGQTDDIETGLEPEEVITQEVTVEDWELRKKGVRQYMLLICKIDTGAVSNADNLDEPMTTDLGLWCWHKNSMFGYLQEANGKQCDFGIVRHEKNDDVHYTIERIDRIGDVLFSNGKPVTQPTAAQIGF